MRATEPGRVIGKALTGLSGTDKGTIVVFIQNTYFDGVDEVEYADSQSLTGLAINPGALDRFSFMVKKSLAKIDPNYVSSGSALDTLGASLSSFTTNLTEIAFQVQILSGALATMSESLARYESERIAIGTSTENTDTIIPIIPESISGEDQLALNMLLATAENLIIQAKTIFEETVAFTQSVIFEKAVVFKSLVTFEDRVIFSDRDMGG